MNVTTPRRMAVLGASGATGLHLVAGALDRGHDVHAIVRDPVRFAHEPHPNLSIHRGDVYEPASIAAAITPDTIVVSALGVTDKRQVGTLTAGARALVAARPARIVWLGAVGTGRSVDAVGRLTARLLRAGFGAEYDDKVTADALVIGADGTVVHSGPLSNGRAAAYRSVPLSAARRRFFPAFVPHPAVAQVILDEAESGAHPGQIVLPRRGAR